LTRALRRWARLSSSGRACIAERGLGLVEELDERIKGRAIRLRITQDLPSETLGLAC
jgi:hypothetical protein